eukprot:jgi/Ulvmu1/6742/UM030_0077.1
MSTWATTHSSHWSGSQQGQTSGNAQTHSAWPPYRLPSDFTHDLAGRSYQASNEPRSRSGLALQPFSRTQAPEVNTRGQASVAPPLRSTSAHVPIHTPLQSSSAYNVSQGAFEANARQHSGANEGAAKIDLYHMAHLSFPKTWVHLWDRAPLSEADTFLSTDHKLEVVLHSSAFPTIWQVAANQRDEAKVLAVQCREDVVTNNIRITIYGEAFQGDGKEPYKVDSFVSIRKTPAPHYVDEATIVNGLAATFQAACSASSTVRLCHLLPLELTVAPLPQPDEEGAPTPQTAHLTGTVVQPAAPLKLTQLHRMRVLESMLSARLMRPGASDGTAGEAFRSGLLSIEQSRALVPLLHGDPMASRAPLVGIWVSGVTRKWHPYTVSAAMAFHACAGRRRCKTLAPDGSFLLLMFPSGTGNRQPELFEALVDAPNGLPLLPYSISLDIPAQTQQGHREGAAAASRIPSPQSAPGGMHELRSAAVVEQVNLIHCLQAGRDTAGDEGGLNSAQAGGRDSSRSGTPTCSAAASVPGAPGACMSLPTWQSDPPVSAMPALGHAGPRGAGDSTVSIAAYVDPAGAGGSGRSSSLSHAASRSLSRSALATWSREFSAYGHATAGGARADTPTATAASTGVSLPRPQQSLVTPRLHDMHAAHASHAPVGGSLSGAEGYRRVPPVPAPSPLVADSALAYTQRPGATPAAAAPAAISAGVPHSTATRWGPQPAASVTGLGPLSLGSMPPVASVPSRFSAVTAASGSGWADSHSARGTAGAVVAGSGAGAAQGHCSSGSAGLSDPPVLASGMPDWLTSAVGRHPELAELLQRNAAAAEAAEPAKSHVAAPEHPIQREEVATAQHPAAHGANSNSWEDGNATASRSTIKRQRNSEEGGTAPPPAGEGGDSAGAADATADEETAALTALLEGDADAGSNLDAREESLHAVLAPGGMSEAEIAALATRSPSHAASISPARRPSEPARPAMAETGGEGAGGAEGEATAPAMHVVPAALGEAGEVGMASDEGAPECLSTPGPPRGPSAAHRAIKSPRIGHLSRPGEQRGPAAGADALGVAMGVPAVAVGQAMPPGTAAALAQLMPLPLPPLPQSADPEAAAAMAPLYAYIARLHRHIEVLQSQLQSGHAGVRAAGHPPQLQASIPDHGRAAGPFPGVPRADDRHADTAPDSPPALPPAAAPMAQAASLRASQHGQPAAASHGPLQSAAASPAHHEFKIIRASGRHSAVSPSVDPHASQGGHSAAQGDSRTSHSTQQATTQYQSESSRRERQPDVLRDSLEAAAASFLHPGDESDGQSHQDAHAAEDTSTPHADEHSTAGAGTSRGLEGVEDQTQGRSVCAESEGSRIQAAWPAQEGAMTAATQRAGRPPSRQVTGAMFGGSPDKVYSTDELKAALAAAEAAAEAAVAPAAHGGTQQERPGLSDDAADAIVDSFLVASHSPQRNVHEAAAGAARGSMQEATLSSKRGRGVRGAGGSANHDGHALRLSQGRDWGAQGQGSPSALVPPERKRSEAHGVRTQAKDAPPVAAAASALDVSSVCPETEAPSTPAAPSHGRRIGGSSASGATDHRPAPMHGADSPHVSQAWHGKEDTYAGGDRSTCLSPELAALIADAAVEHCTSGAAASRAVVCIEPRDSTHNMLSGSAAQHGCTSDRHAPPHRWGGGARRYGAASWNGSQSAGAGSSHAAESCVRWSAATGSTLGTGPSVMHRPREHALSQKLQTVSRPPMDIPRIQFPATKAGMKIQRRYMRKKGEHVEDSSTTSSEVDSDDEKLERKYGIR